MSVTDFQEFSLKLKIESLIQNSKESIIAKASFGKRFHKVELNDPLVFCVKPYLQSDNISSAVSS